MNALLNTITIETTAPSVTIHFQDGGIQDAILQSHSSTRQKVAFIPCPTIVDRRKFPRTLYMNEVRVDRLGVRRLTDISNRGMYVECLAPNAVGTIVTVAFEFDGEPFCLDTRVIFIDPGIGMGLEFYRIPSAVQLKLDLIVHKITENSPASLITSRRHGKDRRIDTGPMKKMRIRRHSADRRKPTPPEKTVEVDLVDIKAIFFHGDFTIPHPSRATARIEFHDGEELCVNLFEIEPEPEGLFAELRMSDTQSYTLYIVKSSIKEIHSA